MPAVDLGGGTGGSGRSVIIVCQRRACVAALMGAANGDWPVAAVAS